MPSSFMAAITPADASVILLNRGVGYLGEANTSLKLMLMGVSGACFFDFLEANGEMLIMLL